MSAWIEKAEMIETRLKSLAALAGIPVMVDKQKDMTSFVDAACAKERGACVLVMFDAATLGQPGDLTSEPRHLVSIVSTPILRAPSATPALELAEAAALGLHGHMPDGAHCHEEWAVSAPILVVGHPKYLIYSFPVSSRAVHSAPEISEPDPEPEP